MLSMVALLSKRTRNIILSVYDSLSFSGEELTKTQLACSKEVDIEVIGADDDDRVPEEKSSELRKYFLPLRHTALRT